MGLDTTHDCWHGGYISFTNWRNKIGEAAGYEIGVGPNGIPGVLMPEGWWEALNEDNYLGQWDKQPDDVLLILIAHSDCDGVIVHRDTKPLMDRLTELLPKIPDETAGGHIGNWREKTQTFIDGLLRAHVAGEGVRFH